MKTIMNLVLMGLAASLLSATVAAQNTTFTVVPSAGAVASNCIPNAKDELAKITRWQNYSAFETI